VGIAGTHNQFPFLDQCRRATQRQDQRVCQYATHFVALLAPFKSIVISNLQMCPVLVLEQVIFEGPSI
jgi:hypothetical protein